MCLYPIPLMHFCNSSSLFGIEAPWFYKGHIYAIRFIGPNQVVAIKIKHSDENEKQYMYRVGDQEGLPFLWVAVMPRPQSEKSTVLDRLRDSIENLLDTEVDDSRFRNFDREMIIANSKAEITQAGSVYIQRMKDYLENFDIKRLNSIMACFEGKEYDFKSLMLLMSLPGARYCFHDSHLFVAFTDGISAMNAIN